MGAEGYVLVLHSDQKYTITGETGRYYICGNTQFRKSSRQIVKIEPPKRRRKPADRKEEA